MRSRFWTYLIATVASIFCCWMILIGLQALAVIIADRLQEMVP